MIDKRERAEKFADESALCVTTNDWNELTDLAEAAFAEVEAEASGRWVSVEERLPEVEVSVLLCVLQGDPKQAHRSEAISGYRMTDPENYTPEEWDNENGASFPAEYSTDEWGAVTHWMPLPEPPEEKP